MKGSEQGRSTPKEYIKQLAKEAVGIGAFQREREYWLEKDPQKKDPQVRLQAGLNSAIVGTYALLAPATTRLIKASPDPSMEKYGWRLTIASVLIDMGVDAGTILLVATGHIGEGVAVKATYNVGVNTIFDRIKNSAKKSAS